MQIGPSLSVLQALGSQPGMPEPARLKPAAHVEATAEVQRAAQLAEPPVAVEAGRGGSAPRPGSEARAQDPGRRLDILV